MLRWTALCAVAGTACADGTDLLLKACNTSDPSQRFAQTSVPSNLPSSDVPRNAAQVVLTAAAGCPTSGGSRCCMNVEAWGTKAGDRVWTTICAAVEPVEHELNRIWVHDNTTGSSGDVLLNPASKMCADAPGGVNAEPGDRLQLVDCRGPNASKWVFSAVDGSLSQASHSGAYPGLCVASYVAPTPAPAPAPSPKTVSARLNVPTSGDAVATTSQEMVSFNLDWHENNEETPLWINMSALVLDLKNPKLVAAAKALSPAVLRIGGSEGDVLCYDVPQFNSTCADMNQTDPAMCLPMGRLEELCEFASNTGLSMAFGLNAVWGRKDHDLNNPLDFTNIEALLAYVSSQKLEIFGFELGNEKCGPPPPILAGSVPFFHWLSIMVTWTKQPLHLSLVALFLWCTYCLGDYWKLKGLLEKYWPDAKSRPRLIGNDCNTNPACVLGSAHGSPGVKGTMFLLLLRGEWYFVAGCFALCFCGRYLAEFLPLLNNSVLDVLTYHRYIGNGIDPNLVHKMMQPSFLDQVVSSDLQAVHTQYAPSAELWVGEGAAAWHSGQDGATNAFASSFWWSNALGALAANNHTHYCRQVGLCFECLRRLRLDCFHTSIGAVLKNCRL
eukprot:INCI7031.9.p1 GENE.INCI7031.9~~INCI7031.9.p1  ORF type:complete len:612 (+),score=63.50 INCI7031.9:363-2198(+)